MPEELYNSNDFCNLAEEFERYKQELSDWKWVARLLSKELTEMHQKYESLCWEDADESSYAQVLYKQLTDRIKHESKN